MGVIPKVTIKAREDKIKILVKTEKAIELFYHKSDFLANLSYSQLS